MALNPKDYILGEDLTAQVERKTPGLVVSARLDPEDATRLLAIARQSGRTVSQIAREALRKYITESEQGYLFKGETVLVNNFIVLSQPRSTAKTFTQQQFTRLTG